MSTSFEESLKDADAILLLVKHAEFIRLQPQELASITKARIVVDTVDAWNVLEWQNEGFRFHRLGDNKTKVA
jgi:UDP-N-acetyl-D-mannosaminuronate dehydrogenase